MRLSGQRTYLHGSTTADDPNPFHLAICQCFQSVVGDIRLAQSIHIREQNAGNIKSHVALSDDHGIFPRGKVGCQISMLWKPIVPSDKLAS